ncbi:MAG: right-handed parallel beta-helix repeat-containing protein, partial [Planctomycetota bacterium]
VVNSPLSLRGTLSAITLSGSPTATSGIVLTQAASGSRITSLAFSGFSGTAIQLNSAQNVQLTGLKVSSSGIGLGISGNSQGTIVQGNTFSLNPIGINLTSATGVMIGGLAVPQRNTIEGSTRAGIFASGFCTRSSVIKTVFPRNPRTPVPYNVRSSRNLRIVR